MAGNKAIGEGGEKLAATYLEGKGYIIEHMNWKGLRFEIDIIARQGNKWIFVEVKTRTRFDFGWPERAVNKRKKNHIIKAADHFIFTRNIEDELRFDIIAIVKRPKKTEIYHIEDAFAPGR